MKKARGTHCIFQEHSRLLKDESSFSGGNCQIAAWPETEKDCSVFLKECREDGVGVTVSGARTGIAGGSVPLGGAVLSTEKLLGIRETGNPGIIRVMAGETLDSVEEYCRINTPGFFYPPDPTETTASIGGTIATDASGSSGYMYGSTRNWIDRISVVLPSGKPLAVRRGNYRFIRGRLTHPELGTVRLPSLIKPQPPKNAAGFFIRPGMDLIDLFIGSEGELGVICSADLILAEKPHAVATLAVFCSEEQFWKLWADLAATKLPVRELEAMLPPCLDFLEKNTGLTAHPPGEWVLIASLEASSEDDIDTILEAMEVLLEENDVSPDNTWGGFDEQERSKFREFRHSLPETVNRIIAGLSSENPSIHKTCTDTAVPRQFLREYYSFMNRVLAETGVEHLVFGHAGQGHLHSNLIPKTNGEMELSERAVETLAKKAVSLGGTVSAEHGIGKLKKQLLKLMYTQKELEGMELLKTRIISL